MWSQENSLLLKLFTVKKFNFNEKKKEKIKKNEVRIEV